MTRRDLIALLGGTAVSWPVGVRAQQLQRMRRIGVLSAGPVEPTSPSMTVLPNALRQLGWTEGKCGSWDGPKGKTSRSNVGTRAPREARTGHPAPAAPPGGLRSGASRASQPWTSASLGIS